MLEQDDLEKLMSLVGLQAGKSVSGASFLDESTNEMVYDLASLLSLPEFREENNADLPFKITARYRGNTWKDSIQTIGMENVRYNHESAFLAEWMGHLSGRPKVHCFDRTLTTEYGSQEEGFVQLRISRRDGKNSLHLSYEGPHKKGETLEIWEKGELLRRINVTSEGAHVPCIIQDGIAVVVRRRSNDSGVEILIAEGEFGESQWKALLACLCLQGSFTRAMELLKDPIAEEFVRPTLLSRFRAFLSGLAAVTKVDGYVLHPLPVVRSQETLSGLEIIPAEAIPPRYQETWGMGWKHLARREFSPAAISFSSCKNLGRKEWSLPLEERLVSHLESLSSTRFSTREEVERNAHFWKGVFQDLFITNSI